MSMFASPVVQQTGGNQTVDPPADIPAGYTWVFIFCINNASSAPTIPGFSPVTSSRTSSASNRIHTLVKKYTSASTEAVDLAGMSSSTVFWHFLVRGVPDNARYLSAINEHECIDENDFGHLDCADGGTNQLLLYAVCSDNDEHITLKENEVNVLGRGDSTCAAALGYKTMQVAGTSPDVTFCARSGLGTKAFSLILAIPDDGTGCVEQDVTNTNETLLPIGRAAIVNKFAPYNLAAPQRFTYNNSTGVFTKVDGADPVNGKLVRLMQTAQIGFGLQDQRLFMVDASGATCKMAQAPNTSTAVAGTISGLNTGDILTALDFTPVNDAAVTPTTTANGLTAGTAYYIINVSGATFQVSTTRNGAAAAITADFASMTLVPRYLTLNFGMRRTLAKDTYTCTLNITTEQATFNDWTPVNGAAITLSELATTTGISNGSIYYIVNASGSAAQLASTPGGSAINLGTGNGTAVFQTYDDNTVGEILVSSVGIDVNIATNTITAHGFTPANDNRFTLRALSGGTGLTTTPIHWMVNVSGQTFQASLTQAGAAVSVTTNVTYADIWFKMATCANATDIWTAIGWTPADGNWIIADSITGGSGHATARFMKIINASGQDFQLTEAESGADTVLNITTTDVSKAIIIECTGDTFAAGNTITASVDGITVLGGSGLHTQAPTYNEWNNNNSGDNNTLMGPEIVFASAKNFTGKFFAVQFQTVDQTLLGRLGYGVILGDGTNWAAYTCAVRAGSTSSENVSCLIDLATATPVASSGTLNIAAITKYKLFFHKSSGASTTSCRLRVVMVAAISKQVIWGGGTATPATLLELWKTYNGNWPNLMRYGGRGQSTLRMNVEIGDAGTHLTNFSAVANSIESALPFTPNNAINRQLNIGSGALELAMNLGASDVANFAPSLYVGSIRPKFTIRATSSNSATKNFQGANDFDTGTWTGKTGVNFTGRGWTGSLKIMGEGATYTECSINGSASTTAAMQLLSGGGAVGCGFTRGAETYAIEMPDEAGDTTLNLSDTTFTGYAGANKHLNLLKTTGTVTITLSAGQDQPTYDTAGATVVWDAPILSTTWTNEDLADGTTILVRNITTSTTIVYTASIATGTGYSITLTPGVDYAVGDVVHILQSRKSGTNYWKTRTSIINTTAGGGDIVEAGDLESCTVCDDIGKDGEDYVTAYDLDSTDDELDILLPGAWFADELMVWWMYQMTQQAPMEEFWGAWEVMDDGSFRNNVSTMSSYLDTTAAGDCIEQTGRRVFRSDGARPIKSPTTSNYTVDCSWRVPVSTVAVGSGVLPADVAAIAAASAVTVWDEVLTKATHNVAQSAGVKLRHVASPIITDGTAQGAGTGNNQIQLATSASSSNGAYDPAVVSIVAGTGAGQSRIILQYDGSTRTATVHRSWRVNPDATSDYIIQEHAELVSVNEGLAQDGDEFSITLNADASTIDGAYVGQLVFLVSGTGEDQSGLITAYNGTTKVATIETGLGGGWATIPDTTTAYVIMPASPVLLAAADLTAKLVKADEVHTATTVQKIEAGTANVLLTKNWTGKPLVNFQAVQP